MADEKQITDKVKIALLSMQRHSWEQGTAMQAFLEQGDMDIVVAMAKEAVYRSLPDGRTAVLGNSNAATDPCSVGEALKKAAEYTQDKSLKEGYDKLLLWALEKAPRNMKDIVYHFVNRYEFWIDSMYMLPPFLAVAGYHKEAIKQVHGYWNALYQPQKKLMSHMWDDDKQEYVRKAAWGVGNGWALAGITRVINALPEEMKEERSLLIEMLRELLKGVLSYMTPQGLFHDIVDDTSSFIEVNLSQMTAYTLYRGMQGGYIESNMLEIAEKLKKAAFDKVDSYGLVQEVCGAPRFDKAGVAAEGQAFFLLMQAASRDYYKKTGGLQNE